MKGKQRLEIGAFMFKKFKTPFEREETYTDLQERPRNPF